MSTLTENLELLDRVCERRFYQRFSPRTLTEVSFAPAHIGTLLDLSDNGLSVFTQTALELDSVWRVDVALHGVREKVRLYVRTIWYDPDWQKAGLQFLNLEEGERSLLRVWADKQHFDGAPASAQAAHEKSKTAPSSFDASGQAGGGRFSAAPPPPMPSKPPLLSHRTRSRVPIHYFWASAALTFLLGGAWAAIVSVLPEKPRNARLLTAPSKPARPQVNSVPETKISSERPSAASPPATSVAPRALRSPAGETPTHAPALQPPGWHATFKAPAYSHDLAKPVAPPAVGPLPSKPPSPPLADDHTVASAAGPYAPLNPKPIVASPPPVPNNSVERLNAPSLAAPSQPLPPKAAVPERSAGSASPALAAAAVLPPPSAPPAPPYTTHVLDVSSFRSAAYVQVPGESVVHGANLTMHIQRSVWVKANHWMGSSRRKVELGELAARVDPQLPRPAVPSGRPAYGSVTVLATIGKDGQIHGVRPLYGSSQLVGNASNAIRVWRFRPTYVDRQAAETLAKIEVDFHAPEQPHSR